MAEDKRHASKIWERLTFRLAGMFVVFSVFVILVSSYFTHVRMEELVHHYSKETVAGVARDLAASIERDGDLFRDWQHYMLEHGDDLHIPYEGTSAQELFDTFLHHLQDVYPGKVFELDVSFQDLPDDLKEEFAAYYQLYWMDRFAEARDAFNLPYAYYLTIDEPIMTYVIDAERMPDEDDPNRLMLLDTDERTRQQLPVMYTCWGMQGEVDDLDVTQDEYGYTCTYYVPITIDGEFLGLVAADGDVNVVEQEIQQNTRVLVALLSFAVIVGVYALSRVVNAECVSRLTLLNGQIETYTRDKDPTVADEIRGAIQHRDEIATLSHNIASMITDIEQHIANIIAISSELSSAQDRAAKLDDLARTDSMTGLMNKLSYTECMDRLDQEVQDGTARFSVTMIDLNFLKRMNDTYGHDVGDAAISRLAADIKQVYPSKTSFRVGGDEFVVVLEGAKVEETEYLRQLFITTIKDGWTDDPATQLSAAVGSATYTDETRSRDVFDKADVAMYENKKAMKAVRKS